MAFCPPEPRVDQGSSSGAEAVASAHWVVVSCRSLWKPMQSRAYVESMDKWAQGGPPH